MLLCFFHPYEETQEKNVIQLLYSIDDFGVNVTKHHTVQSVRLYCTRAKVKQKSWFMMDPLCVRVLLTLDLSLAEKLERKKGTETKTIFDKFSTQPTNSNIVF